MNIEPFVEGPHCRQLCPPDPLFATLHQELANFLQAHLQTPHLLEHIGSTSIPNILAKPMLDTLLVVSRESWETIIAELEQLGFHDRSTRASISEKPYRGCSVLVEERRININIHIVAPQSQTHLDLIYFRDRLRQDPALAAHYEDIKRDTFARGIVQPGEYNDVKWPFIQNILAERLHSPRID